MLMPILEDHAAGSAAGEAIIKTISSRLAGGRKEAATEPSRVRSSPVNSTCLCLTDNLGYHRYARVLFDTTFASPRFQALGHTCDVDCRRLHTDTRHLRGTKEHPRLEVQLQQWTIVHLSTRLCFGDIVLMK